MNAVFRKAIRDSRWTVIWMSIGLALYALMVLSFYPTILDQKEEMDELLKNYPEEMLMLISGGEDINEISFTDPGTYLNAEFITWMVLILGVMVTLQAFNAVTNAERNGTMDILMSFPISRRQMLVARFANTIVSLLLVLTACFLTILLAREIWPEFELSTGHVAAGIYGSFFILAAHASFTYLLVAVIPSSKRWVGAIAYTLFLGGYLVYSLSGLNDTLKDIQPFLLFDYYNATALFNNGLDFTDASVMVAVTLLFSGLAWWRIEKKELGV